MCPTAQATIAATRWILPKCSASLPGSPPSPSPMGCARPCAGTGNIRTGSQASRRSSRPRDDDPRGVALGLRGVGSVKIAVIGTGYVGLVTSTCLAASGNDVIGSDTDAREIQMLDGGQLPIYEPGLLELVTRNRREQRLAFTTDLTKAVQSSSLIFIAVGTPQGADGAAELSNLWAVADAMASAFNGHKIVIIKSTVPVGTNRLLGERLAKKATQPFDVASNPE